MLGYKKIKKKLRMITTSSNYILDSDNLYLEIPTKTKDEDKISLIRDLITTKILIVYADMSGIPDDIIPIVHIFKPPFYAISLFNRPEDNTGSNYYSGTVLNLTIRTAAFEVKLDDDGAAKLYFKIPLYDNN